MANIPTGEDAGVLFTESTAHHDAGVKPDTIGFIRPHGTGTRAEDGSGTGATRRVPDSPHGAGTEADDDSGTGATRRAPGSPHGTGTRTGDDSGTGATRQVPDAPHGTGTEADGRPR
ncbi:hypothetical protein ACFWZ2_05850 [Streptomyces sp. NPDC059002]|uniref:hypothetical protein n=1 Tax=Streptomyces sp. NPDC059002 TaxID=3346690 RepID=UPI0036BF28AC